MVVGQMRDREAALRTVAGEFLYAHLTEDKYTVKRLKDDVEENQSNVAFFRCALSRFAALAVPGAEVRAITRYAHAICGRGTMGLGQRQQRIVEAVIRESFGEERICEGLPDDEIGLAAVAVMMDVVVQHMLSLSEIGEIIAGAEEASSETTGLADV
jgi:hypothetical protein